MNSTTDMRILSDFLQQTQDELSNLSPSELQLVLGFYTKMHLLRSNASIKTDDWDWISLGLFMKSMYEQQQPA
jgi:hypothetical protein